MRKWKDFGFQRDETVPRLENRETWDTQLYCNLYTLGL
jgi:hypothetical protein